MSNPDLPVPLKPLVFPVPLNPGLPVPLCICVHCLWDRENPEWLHFFCKCKPVYKRHFSVDAVVREKRLKCKCERPKLAPSQRCWKNHFPAPPRGGSTEANCISWDNNSGLRPSLTKILNSDTTISSRYSTDLDADSWTTRDYSNFRRFCVQHLGELDRVAAYYNSRRTTFQSPSSDSEVNRPHFTGDTDTQEPLGSPASVTGPLGYLSD